MTVLLDTCVLIWLSSAPDNIPSTATTLIDDQSNNLFVSDATILEIALKHSIGKLSLPESPENWIGQQLEIWGITTLPIGHSDIFESAKLPWIHKDPFDRLLIATAKNHALTVITPDHVFGAYSLPIVWE